MQLTRTKEQANPRELTLVDNKWFYKGIDVTEIAEVKGSNFVSLMGRVGGKEFHNYFGKQEDGSWSRFTGVTSALDYVGDKGSLMQWYANQVVEQFGWSKQLPEENAAQYKERLWKEMGEKVEIFNLLSASEKIEFIVKARTAATMYTRRTANLGKTVHKEIENYIKLSIKEYAGVAMPRENENEQVVHFINWAVKNKVVFKASELQVYSKKYWYAGTLDLVIEINGELFVGDIKTTNSIWGRSYFAQIAAYRMALEEMFPDRYKFAGSIIVRIGRDGLFNPEDDVHFSPYFDDDKRFFLAGLEIYRQENNIFNR